MTTVDHALAIATNEGRFYDRFLRAAMIERKGGCALSGTVGSAQTWVSLVQQLVPTLKREDVTLTCTEALILALALRDYYADHLNEATPEERIAIAKRLGV